MPFAPSGSRAGGCRKNAVLQVRDRRIVPGRVSGRARYGLARGGAKMAGRSRPFGSLLIRRPLRLDGDDAATSVSVQSLRAVAALLFVLARTSPPDTADDRAARAHRARLRTAP